MKKKRGRPPTYDPDLALDAALKIFWRRGFSATSLDDISTATGMTRPSLYSAFGNKKAIYRKSLDHFNRKFFSTLDAALTGGDRLEDDLIAFYSAALSVYRTGKTGTLGCPVLCTAPVEAALDADIQTDLAMALNRIDMALVRRFHDAQRKGQLGKVADPKKLGRLAAAVLHSLAVRVRSGQKGFNPEDFIRSSAEELAKG